MRVQPVAAPLMACHCARFAGMAQYVSAILSANEYNALMAETTVKAWECDLCGYVWLKVAGKVPKQCAKKGCRSRLWNSGKVAGAERVALMAKPAKIEAAKPEIDLQAMAEAEEIQAAAYKRPAHSSTCTCMMCGSKK